MKQPKKIKMILGIIVSAVFTFAIIASASVSAVTEGKTVAVSPPVQKLSLEPGSTYEGSYTAANNGTEEFEYAVQVVPYSVTGDNYTPNYSEENSYTQLSKWVKLSKTSGSLKPGENDTINFTITVPNGVPAGGQYAAITTAAVDNKDDSKALTTVTRVAMVLYVNISGETRKEGSILENNVPSIVFGGNKLSTSSLVQNTGNVHDYAKYIMRIYPFGSGEEIFSNEEEPYSIVVMPETKRYYSMSWEDTPQIGLYTVEQEIQFMGQTSTTSKLVLICPIWLIVIFIALILAIIFTIITRARSRNQSKRESSASRSHHSSEGHDKSEDKE